MLKKWPADEPTGSRHQIFHPRSAEGEDKKRARQKSKKQRSRQAKARAKMQAKTAAAKAAAASASTAAEGSVEPLWLRPEAIPEGAEETEPGLPSGSEEEAMDLESYSPQHGRGSPGSPQNGEEEDSNTLELVERSPGSSMSSGLQDQSEAYDKGKGKGKQLTSEELHAAGFSSFVSAGTASSSTPYSRTDVKGSWFATRTSQSRKRLR